MIFRQLGHETVNSFDSVNHMWPQRSHFMFVSGFIVFFSIYDYEYYYEVVLISFVVLRSIMRRKREMEFAKFSE